METNASPIVGIQIQHDMAANRNKSETLVVLFTFFALFLGAIFREVHKKYKIPYNPLLLLIGIIWGYYQVNFGMLGDAIIRMQDIDPYGILMIFVPTLIFESAFNSDWYIFKRQLGSLLVLAGPGVLLGIFMTAICMRIFLGYSEQDLSWSAALMLGSIISCTDPVAVGAFLRAVGASTKFKILIEGESLLNGGSGMILFILFGSITRGNEIGVIEFVGSMLQMAGGGPLLGLLFGLVSSLWLQRITRDSTLSITVAFISCYLLFLVAEQWDVSGILAVVTLGLFYSAYGKTKIDSEADQALHTVWSWAQYSCETLIFLITGTLVGYQIIHSKTSLINFGDVLSMLGLFIIVFAVRFLIVLFFMPIIGRIGYGMGWREVIVLTFGGLRGTLSLALALMVGVDDRFPERTRELVIFHVAGVTSLSLWVNSTISSILIDWLGMENGPEIKKKIHKNILADLFVQSKKRFEAIKVDKGFNICDWATVNKKVGLDDLISEINKDQNYTELKEVTRLIERRSAYNAFEDDEIYREARYRLIRILRGLFWEKYEECQINADSVRLLIEACNVSLDNTNVPINLWEFFYGYFTSFKSIKFFFKIRDFFIIGRLATRFIANHLAFIYEVTTTFIKCSQELAEVQGEIPLSKDHIKTVMEELDKNIYDANNYICTLEDNFIEIIKTIQIKRASSHILLFQRQYLQKLYHSGQIDEQEYNKFRTNIDRRILELDLLKIDWQIPSFSNFVMEFPVFSNLKTSEINAILSQATSRAIIKGEFLYEKDKPTYGVYIITKGIVKEILIDKNSLKKSLGSILSFANLINENDVALTTCEATTDVHATCIPNATLKSIMQQNPEFEEKCYKNSIPYLVAIFTEKCKDLSLLEERTLIEFVKEGKLRRFKDREIIRLTNGGFIFSGEIKRVIQEIDHNRIIENKYEKCSYIPPIKDEMMVMQACVIIEFNKSLREFRGDKLNGIENNNFLKIDSCQDVSLSRRSAKRSVEEDFEYDSKVNSRFHSIVSDGDHLVS